MTFAIEVTAKNTFITFVAKPTNSVPRSRSAESVRNRPEADRLRDRFQPCLETLSSVINAGLLSPANLPPPNSPGKLWDEQSGVHSSCSLSEISTDVATASPRSSNSGYLESPTQWIRQVSSSGSLSSLVSGCSGSTAEADTRVALEVNIEARSAAAGDEATIEQPAPVARDINPGKVTAQMRHAQVPKNHNMAEMYKSIAGEAPTTIMVRNIPGKYTQNDLMQDLSDACFGGTYDFLYLPMDKGTGGSVGYAFVNFVAACVAADFMKSFEGFCFSYRKLARVSVAHLQGLKKNLEHYENSSVNMPKQQRRRPVIIANISSMFE